MFTFINVNLGIFVKTIIVLETFYTNFVDL